MEFSSTFFTTMTWNVKKRINCLQLGRCRSKRIVKIGENKQNTCDIHKIDPKKVNQKKLF